MKGSDDWKAMNIPVWQIHKMENVVRQARGFGATGSELGDCMEEIGTIPGRGVRGQRSGITVGVGGQAAGGGRRAADVGWASLTVP
jgi:hypothetical protein